MKTASEGHHPSISEGVAKKLSAAALAVSVLLAQSSAPAQSSLNTIVDNAKQHAVVAEPAGVKRPPPLTLKPSGTINLRGGGRGHSSHSSHASHASHSSHYSSSGGGGNPPPTTTNPPPAATDPPRTPPRPKQAPTQDNPSDPRPPSDSTPNRDPTPEKVDPYLVFVRDGRQIRCVDVKDEADSWLLVKRAGVIKLRKAEVIRIERVDPSSTQPTTKPTSIAK
jgi:hypothetical protein